LGANNVTNFRGAGHVTYFSKITR